MSEQLWLQHVKVGIVGGSDLVKICEQLGGNGGDFTNSEVLLAPLLLGLTGVLCSCAGL